MLSGPDFVPFEPPPRPLGLVGLPLLWPNYIEAIPRAGYEQGVTRVQTRWSDLVLVCDPELAFGDNDGIIADHRPERPAGRRVAPEGFGVVDKNLRDQVGVADQYNVGPARLHARDPLLVGCARNRLDIVAP